jgi:hypothetical protein
MAYLLGEQGSGDYPPTDQGEAVRQQLTQEIDTELRNLDALIEQNVNRINTMVKDKGIDMVMVKKGPVKM